MHNNTGIHVVARGVIIDQGHILIAHDLRLNMSLLPGGHIEKGESAQTAVLRELAEEVGHTFTIQRFLGCLEHDFTPEPHINYCHTHSYSFIFLVAAPSLSKEKLPTQVEEYTMLQWIPLTELHTIPLMPKPFVHLIPRWLDNATTFHSEIKV